MMRALSLLCLLALISGVVATNGTAQWSRVAGSGCRGVAHLVGTRGQPKLGQTIAVSVRCSSRGDTPHMIVGLQSRTVPITPPIACRTTCNLVLVPVVIAPGRPGQTASIAVKIPQQRFLIGARLRFQGLCLTTTQPCITLATAVDATVQA